MTFTISYINNFIRIFELPEELSSEYCFDGGIDHNFKLVDWFNPVVLTYNVPNKIIGGKELERVRNNLREFVKKKEYYNPTYQYLAITAYKDTFLI